MAWSAWGSLLHEEQWNEPQACSKCCPGKGKERQFNSSSIVIVKGGFLIGQEEDLLIWGHILGYWWHHWCITRAQGFLDHGSCTDACSSRLIFRMFVWLSWVFPQTWSYSFSRWITRNLQAFLWGSQKTMVSGNGERTFRWGTKFKLLRLKMLLENRTCSLLFYGREQYTHGNRPTYQFIKSKKV